jgi:sterol 14-demethylase
MRVIIDRELCRGHGACMGEVPEVFEVDEHGALTVLQERPPSSLAARLAVAEQYCPTGALRIEPDAGGGAGDDAADDAGDGTGDAGAAPR